MPRNAKRTTQTGQAAQPIGAAPGQQYGAGVEQMALQRNMPAPQVQGAPTGVPTPAVAPGAGSVVPVPGPGTPSPADPNAAMRAAAAMRDQTGLLAAPTNRPNEPITAGLTRGPGAGPEALVGRQGSPAGDMLRALSASTGDPLFAQLAMKARA